MDQPLAALEVYRTGLDVFQGDIFNFNKYLCNQIYSTLHKDIVVSNASSLNKSCKVPPKNSLNYSKC